MWAGILISAAAIVWAARGVDWSGFVAALGRADWLLLAVVFVLSPVINIGFRAVRWRILLAPVATPPLRQLCSATAIGLLANNVLPARIGEFVRAYALGKRHGMAVGTAFGSLFVERMFDGFALLVILYSLTWLHPLPEWVDTTVRIAFWIFAGFLVFQLFLASRPDAFIRLARRLTRRPFGGRIEEPLGRALVTFVDGFRLLRRPLLAGLSFALAVLQWSTIAVLFWVGLQAFGLGTQAGWEGAFFTTAVSALGVAIPSSPGFVGTFQAFVVEALGVFGVDRTAAFGFAVGYHVVSYVSVTLVGLVAFLRAGWTWREIERSEKRLERELEHEFVAEIAPELVREPEGPRENDGR
jgi:uncharacterized protein (TIRG00374 family)